MDGYLLALETSGRSGGAALVNADGLPVSTRDVDAEMRHGRGLLPAAEACLAEIGAARAEIAAVAVDAGPGSFTGLRIGVMAAKTIAFALSIPVVGVTAHTAIARDARLRDETADAPQLLVCTPARREEAYLAVFDLSDDDASPVSGIRAVSPEEFRAALDEAPDGAVVAGGGFPDAAATAAAETTCRVLSGYEQPTAASVGVLGVDMLTRNPAGVPLHELQPLYPRRADRTMPVLGEPVRRPE